MKTYKATGTESGSLKFGGISKEHFHSLNYKQKEKHMPQAPDTCNQEGKQPDINREDFNPYRVVTTTMDRGSVSIIEDDYCKVIAGHDAHKRILIQKMESMAQELANCRFELAHAHREISRMNEDTRKQGDTIKRQADKLSEKEVIIIAYSNDVARAVTMVKSYKKQAAYWKSRAKKLSAKQ